MKIQLILVAVFEETKRKQVIQNKRFKIKNYMR